MACALYTVTRNSITACSKHACFQSHSVPSLYMCTRTHTHTQVLLLLERGIQKTQLTEMPLLGSVNHCNALFNTITYIQGSTVRHFSNETRCGVQYKTNNVLCIYTTATSQCSNNILSHRICRNIQYKQI